MFTSKGIKKFCNVVATIVFILAVCSMVLGIVFLLLNLIDARIGLIVPISLIVGGFVSAISLTFALYPLYAMAHMSEKLESIEDMVADLAYGEEEEQEESVDSCPLEK